MRCLFFFSGSCFRTECAAVMASSKYLTNNLITIAERDKRDHNRQTLSSWGEIDESGKLPVLLNACL